MDPAQPERYGKKRNLTRIESDFHDACIKCSECPFCALRESSAIGFLSSFLYENVNEFQVSQQLCRSYGFCREHSLMLLEQTWTGEKNRLGIVIAYERILTRWIDIIDGYDCVQVPLNRRLANITDRLMHSRKISLGGYMSSKLQPGGPCPACECVNESDHRAIVEIAKSLESGLDGEIWNWVKMSFGLCLPHLRCLLDETHADETVRALCKLQTERLRMMRARLLEYVRKQDYRYVNEKLTDEEAVSWNDAVALVIGGSGGE